jgi:hypothetical protein
LIRHDFIKQAYLAIIDDKDRFAFVTSFCHVTIALRFKGIYKKALNITQLLRRDAYTFKRMHCSQTNREFWLNLFLTKTGMCSYVLLKAFTKYLCLTYILESFRLSVFHLVNSINTCPSSFRFITYCTKRINPLPVDSKALHLVNSIFTSYETVNNSSNVYENMNIVIDNSFKADTMFNQAWLTLRALLFPSALALRGELSR